MVISPVSICNSALVKLGAERLNSLTENTVQARVCNEQYEKVRDDLLASHPWNFAVSRKALAEVAGYEDPVGEYGKAFLLPSDALRILSTNLNLGMTLGEEPWEIEVDPTTNQKILLCNISAVAIKYIRRVPEQSFTTLFAELLSLRLAADIAYAITQSSTQQSNLVSLFQARIKEVRSFDAQEGSVRTVEADDFLLARLTGRPGFFSR